jgi:hypothetical protein
MTTPHLACPPRTHSHTIVCRRQWVGWRGLQQSIRADTDVGRFGQRRSHANGAVCLSVLRTDTRKLSHWPVPVGDAFLRLASVPHYPPRHCPFNPPSHYLGSQSDDACHFVMLHLAFPTRQLSLHPRTCVVTTAHVLRSCVGKLILDFLCGSLPTRTHLHLTTVCVKSHV